MKKKFDELEEEKNEEDKILSKILDIIVAITPMIFRLIFKLIWLGIRIFIFAYFSPVEFLICCATIVSFLKWIGFEIPL